MQLGEIARARGVRLLRLEETDSTNEEARRLIETGERGPLWVVAGRQSKGRGRLGREWISPPGNFYASFVCSDFTETRVAPELGFVASVAGMRALMASAGDQGFQLKWPNDFLIGGAKLGGILLECVNPGSAPVAIIGVGMNVAHAPADLPYPARALADLGGAAPTLERFFEWFSDAFVEVLDLWNGGEGFAGVREEWVRHAAGIGGAIRVVLANETVEGQFENIDASGRLVLTTANGRRVIEAGDVLLGPRTKEGSCE